MTIDRAAVQLHTANGLLPRTVRTDRHLTVHRRTRARLRAVEARNARTADVFTNAGLGSRRSTAAAANASRLDASITGE